jgi:hypothetical protein
MPQVELNVRGASIVSAIGTHFATTNQLTRIDDTGEFVADVAITAPITEALKFWWGDADGKVDPRTPTELLALISDVAAALVLGTLNLGHATQTTLTGSSGVLSVVDDRQQHECRGPGRQLHHVHQRHLGRRHHHRDHDRHPRLRRHGRHRIAPARSQRHRHRGQDDHEPLDDLGDGAYLMGPGGAALLLAGGLPAKAITIVGQERFNTSAGGSLNDAVLAGDLVLMFAHNQSSSTVPTLEGNATNIGTTARTTVCVTRVGYRIAASDGQFSTTGTWTNATRVSYIQFRPSHPSYVLGVTGFLTDNATDTAIDIPALTTPAATSWGVHYSGVTTDVNYSSGQVHTNRDDRFSATRVAMWSDPCTGGVFALQNIVVSASTGHCEAAMEITIT